MEMNVFATSAPTNVRIPKVIADIVICGALHIKISEDTAGWIPQLQSKKKI